MNFLGGWLDADKRTVRLGKNKADQSIPLALPGVAKAEVGANVFVGVRPEDLRAPTDNVSLPISVDMCEVLGADTLVHGQLAGQAQKITVRLPGRVRAEAGASQAYGFSADKCHLFDADSGRRIELSRAN